MKKHGNTHKAPRSSKRHAPSHASEDSAQASNDGGKINIATADDVDMGVRDNDRDSGSPSVSDASLSRDSGSRNSSKKSRRASRDGAS